MRFETLRIGVVGVGEVGPKWDARIVRSSARPGYFVVYATSAEGPFDAAEDALAYCARTFPVASWRDDLAVRAGDGACPICAAPLPSPSARYPRALCPPCTLEAVDREGRSVRFYDASAGGGFVARREDGTTSTDRSCWVRGVACWAEEAKFGGIVVQPLAGHGLASK